MAELWGFSDSDAARISRAVRGFESAPGPGAPASNPPTVPLGGIVECFIVVSEAYFDNEAKEHYLFGLRAVDGIDPPHNPYAAPYNDFQGYDSSGIVNAIGDAKIYLPSYLLDGQGNLAPATYPIGSRVLVATAGGKKYAISHPNDPAASFVAGVSTTLEPFQVYHCSPFSRFGLAGEAGNWNELSALSHVGSPSTLDAEHLIALNGWIRLTAAAGDGYPNRGHATLHATQPVLARIHPDFQRSVSGLFAPGTPWGFIPNSPYLWPGLPGFVSLGWTFFDGTTKYARLLDDGSVVTFFLADRECRTCYARATADWSATTPFPSVAARPHAGTNMAGTTYPYDGASVYYGATLPNVTMTVTLPVPVNYQAGTWVRQIDPEIYADTYFAYRRRGGNATGQYPLVAVGPVGSSRIGDLKWITRSAAAPIPPGWRIYAAAQGKFLAAYLNGDPNFGAVGGAGGALTHTHPGGATFGGSGTACGAASHLPPYITHILIERYK